MPKGIGNHLNPKDNSNTFWVKMEISFNKVSSTIVSGANINWYIPLIFFRFLVDEGNNYILFPISSFSQSQEN